MFKRATGAIGGRNLRRVVTLFTSAALSAPLVLAAAGPASAAAAEPARSAPMSLAPGANSRPVLSLTAAARYVHLSNARFTLDARDAKKAGVSTPALTSENAVVTGMNELLDHGVATLNTARDGVVVDVAKLVRASAQDTTITVLPGITLSITSTGVQLSLTEEVVSDLQHLAGFAEHVATFVGAVLALALIAVPYGSEIASSIADIVGAAIGFGSDFLAVCTASDGSATFSVPWPWLWLSGDFPSCSGVSL